MNPPPDTEEPLLDLEGVLAIHRDPNGYIGFARKPDPTQQQLDSNGKPYAFQNLACFKAGDLSGMFPALASWLTHDSYMTLNDYYRAAPYSNRLTGMPDVWRQEKYLQSLTACYSDIDCGRPDSHEPGAALDWRQAQHKAEALADAGIIPQPSIMARSGRGVYLFWLLRDETEPDKLPRAWPEKIQLYKVINKALDARLLTNQLPADLNATDAARFLRVPGSIHRKAKQRVGYVIQLDERGRGFTYTLSELAQALDVETTAGTLPAATRQLAKPARCRRTQNKGTAPKRSEGTRALNALRAQDVFTLHHHRGGFMHSGEKYLDGSTSCGRRLVLSLYALFLRGSGATLSEATAAVESMADGCSPAWPDDPTDPTPAKLTQDTYTAQPDKWTNKKLLRLLGIDSQLARDLDLKTIVPDEVKQERHDAKPTQKGYIEWRQQWLRRYIEDHGYKSVRAIANIYEANGIKGANRGTAAKDWLAIFPQSVSVRKKTGRKRKAVS